MSTATPEQLALTKLIIEVLDLEDVDAQDVSPEAPLFDATAEDSLALDSIDALEISLAIAKTYQVQLKADDENNREIFYSVASLSTYIQANSPS